MAEVRGQRRKERAEGRGQRRARTAEPFEQLDDAAERAGEGSSAVGPQLKRAAATAAAAAFVGGLAGAAKAFADKRGRSSAAPEASDDEESDAAESDMTTESTEAPPEAEQHEEDEEPEEDEEHEEQEEPADEAERPRPSAGNARPQRGADSGVVGEIIARARQHVEDVIGSEADSVSGIDRSNGQWTVTVEVVQMRRVPESTDVLASYAVVVDDDGGLVSLQQTRRYRRSQADEDR